MGGPPLLPSCSAQESSSLKAQFLGHVLTLVNEQGWTDSVLEKAAEDLGYPSVLAWALFPGGCEDVLVCWSRQVDSQMASSLATQSLQDMKIRERIFWAVRTRLALLESSKSAVSKAIRFLLNPTRGCQGPSLVQETVDAMWIAAGDASTDYNYYTKRLLLSGVYVATLFYWLKDTSDGYKDTWAFLERRIQAVLQIQKVKMQMTQAAVQARTWVQTLRKSIRPFS